MSNAVSFEEFLAQNGTLTYTNKGTSMEPLLQQGRDLFTVRKKGPERCRAGDVVLFRRGDSYVLHRVVEVLPDSYVCLGDNSVYPERGVTDGDILGVLTGFVRNGKEHSVTEPGYRAYSAMVLGTRGLRVLWIKAVWKGKRLLRR